MSPTKTLLHIPWYFWILHRFSVATYMYPTQTLLHLSCSFGIIQWTNVANCMSPTKTLLHRSYHALFRLQWIWQLQLFPCSFWICQWFVPAFQVRACEFHLCVGIDCVRSMRVVIHFVRSNAAFRNVVHIWYQQVNFVSLDVCWSYLYWRLCEWVTSFENWCVITITGCRRVWRRVRLLQPNPATLHIIIQYHPVSSQKGLVATPPHFGMILDDTE